MSVFSCALKLALLVPALASVAGTRNAHFRSSEKLAPVMDAADSAFQSAFKMLEVHAPSQGMDAKAPAAGGKQPVGVQVEEKTINNLQKELSPACSKRYASMMKGEGPAMHSFKEHDKSSKSDQCEKELMGSKCHTLAKISEGKEVPDGRKMSSHTTVEGVSCLPKECTSEGDLSVLAKFMHRQTKEIFPDKAIKVALHVDCSEGGGAVVDADGNPDTPSTPQAQRSGASALFGSATLLLCLTLA